MSVGNNGNLPVEPKVTKKTYEDILKSTNAVRTQDKLISKGIDPLDETQLTSLN